MISMESEAGPMVQTILVLFEGSFTAGSMADIHPLLYLSKVKELLLDLADSCSVSQNRLWKAA
jgi:hypothetical protein